MPPRAHHGPGRKKVHWWSNDLTTLRDSTNKLRRVNHRSARRHDHQDLVDAHREAYTAKRKELRYAIRDTQAKSWAELSPFIEARGREAAIADHLFPDPPPTVWVHEPPLADEELQGHEFTMVEILTACKSLPADQNTTGRSDGRNAHNQAEEPGKGIEHRSLASSVLSGHGCFKSNLYRFNRSEDSYCIYCMDPDDTTEYTIFSCPRWLDDRTRLSEILRQPPTTADVEEILCGPSSDTMPEDSTVKIRLIEQATIARQEMIKMFESILATKEQDEREDQADDLALLNRRRATRRGG
ncbi:hypothetical protein QTP88_009939 [Uroleucon formosanum]